MPASKFKNAKMSLEGFDKLFESLKNWGRWGAEDRKGTLNYVTPDKVSAAAALVKSGRTPCNTGTQRRRVKQARQQRREP